MQYGLLDAENYQQSKTRSREPLVQLSEFWRPFEQKKLCLEKTHKFQKVVTNSSPGSLTQWDFSSVDSRRHDGSNGTYLSKIRGHAF